MSHAAFQLVYDGPALVDNEISAKQLANALMGFDTLFSEADHLLNSGKTEARLNVKASFKTGSFKIDLSSASNLIDRARDLLLHDDTGAILTAEAIITMVFSGLWGLVKWAKGRKIERWELKDGKVICYIGDQYFEAEKEAYELFRKQEIRQALEEAIAKPLEKDGVDSFGVIVNKQVIATATKSEGAFFLCPEPALEELQDQETVVHLNLVSPSFQEGDKWRVSDGTSAFYAAINDCEFIKKMLRNEVEFGASTTLKVRLRTIQNQDSAGKLKSQCSIEEVLAVKKAPEQSDLFGASD